MPQIGRAKGLDRLRAAASSGRINSRNREPRCSPAELCGWQKIGKQRQPYATALADRGIMALAGLWEMWRSPTGETVRSFTVITTELNELCAPIYNRMPVILDPPSSLIWLGE